MQFINKYQWLWPSMLFTAGLILLRIIYISDLSYLFIVWNLFLAGLPLLFSYKTLHSSGRKRWVWAFLWLLFFPNSMYIITDLFHLEGDHHVPKWLDLLILYSAAFNGLMLGLLSLRNIEKASGTLLPEGVKKLATAGIFLLCGYGIYLGRYERWNSWDLFTHPLSLAKDIALDVLHPTHHIHVWAISILFGSWLLIMYRYFSKFSPINKRGSR